MEKKPASLLVVLLKKALSGIPPSWCGRQKAGTGVHPARFKGGGSKKNLISHSGADPENFGGGGEILNQVEC